MTKEIIRQLKHLIYYWVMQFNEEEVQGSAEEQGDKFVKEIINIVEKEK